MGRSTIVSYYLFIYYTDIRLFYKPKPTDLRTGFWVLDVSFPQHRNLKSEHRPEYSTRLGKPWLFKLVRTMFTNNLSHTCGPSTGVITYISATHWIFRAALPLER